MHSLLQLATSSQGVALVLALLAGVASLVALLSCILWAVGRAVPPVVPLGAFCTAMGAAVLTSASTLAEGGQVSVASTAMAPSVLAAALSTEHTTHLLLPLVLGVPLLLFIVVAGVIGGLGQPRRLPLAAAVGALTVVLTGLAAANAWGRAPIAFITPPLYLLAGLAIAFGVSRRPGTDTVSTARAAGATAAAMALVLLVGLGDTFVVHLDTMQVLEASAYASDDMKRALLIDGAYVAYSGAAFRTAAMTLAALIGVVSLVASKPSPDGPVVGAAMGLITVPVAVAFAHSAVPDLLHMMAWVLA